MPAHNKFALQSSKTALTNLHSAFATLATDLLKMSNDIRFLASGPNCGLAELILPSNEPGSSIMPGKVNPTQCEMISMVSAQVIGNNSAILAGNSMGHFQLNTFMPLIIQNFLRSAGLLKDSMLSFAQNCLRGLQVNEVRVQSYVESSPMLVTALNPIIGYDKSSQIVKLAQQQKITLKKAASDLKFVKEEEFDRIVNPSKMTHPY